ncbi:hypothetical protein FAGAP_4387 [Fusarium agapanthi]|uniref:Uncharacterized protein n=1 Tax=Fusarium agapanthi TaxID=1803897 RepID=A0A9P5EE31_9HYPO|nr:hypothetical protein FAGAP_4387 [Fusarium agapanthi]
MILRIYRRPRDKRLQVTGLALDRKYLQFLNAIWYHGVFMDLAALEELAGRCKHATAYAQAAVVGRGDCSQSANEDVGDNNEEDEKEDSEGDDTREEEEEDNAEDHSEERGGVTNQQEDRGFTTWVKGLGEITDDDQYDMEVEAGAAPGLAQEPVERCSGKQHPEFSQAGLRSGVPANQPCKLS